MIPLWLACTLAFAGQDSFPVARVRAQAEPVHPLLDVWLRLQGAVPRGRGGRRTQAGTASPGPDGTWMTAHHVVAGADEIELEIDGEALSAHVVGASPVVDLALLRVTTSAPRVGTDRAQRDHAVTSPGFPGDGELQTLAAHLRSTVYMPLPGRPFALMQRLDQPVRRGQSGAPVLRDGVRVGMVVAGSEPDGPLGGDGLALPEPALSRAAIGLLDLDGTRQLGVQVAAEPGGMRIASVTEGSGAAELGLRADDLVIAIDGTLPTSATTVATSVAAGRIDWLVRRSDEIIQVRALPR